MAIGLTRSVAFRIVADGVRANCVCPGHVETPMAKAVKDTLANNPRTPMSKFTDRYANRSEAIYADAEQAANACLCFAGDISKSVTGQTLTVDAGTFMFF